MKPSRRRLPLRHLVAAVVVATIVAVAVTVRDEANRGDDDPSTPTVTAEPPASPLPATTAAVDPAVPIEPQPASPLAPPPAEPSPVRTVTGPGITPLPPADTPPERVAPPERPKPPPPPIVERRLGLVKMEDTAHFSVGAIRVRLPGVAVTGPEDVCRDRSGTEWPCGRRALAGVRAVVRGKAVDCPLPDKVRRGDFVTDCALAGADMAERIVASGWARALDREGPLGEAERQAEARGLGLHGAAMPIGVDPFPDPGEVPPDHTTAPLAGAGNTPAPPAPAETGAEGNATR
jgi:endonuclease YncB( thermonuclease family)